jgi:hypothetical protein
MCLDASREGTMEEQSMNAPRRQSPGPTEVRLKTLRPGPARRLSVFDPLQTAWTAVHAMLLYLGIYFAIGWVPGAASLAARARSVIALIGALLLTGLVFGTVAVLRDRLARQADAVALSPERVIAVDDALHALVPADLFTSHGAALTVFRLNVLDGLVQPGTAAFSSWPEPLGDLAAAVVERTAGPAASAEAFPETEVAKLREYLSERHQDS